MNKVEQLKRQIEQAKQDKTRAETKLQMLRDEMVEEFGCKTIKEAQAELKKLEARAEKKQAELDKVMEEIEEVAS